MNEQNLTTAMLAKLDEAVSLAVFAKHAQIEPLHLLWAIAADSQSCLAQVLNQENISREAVCAALKTAADALPKTSNASASNMRLSADLSQAISRALGACKADGDEFLSVDAYLRSEAEQSVKKYLADFIAPAKLCERLSALRSGRRITDREQSDSAKGLLEEYATELVALAAAGKIDPITGREAELERCMQILLRKSKNNPILLGEPGVGKTAIVEALAQAIADGRVPKSLANRKIYQLAMSDLLAGAKYRGEFEERLQKLIAEVKERPEAIVFIDEIHTILGAGGAEGSASDAAQVLKPALARGQFVTIGATTLKEYKKYFEKDAALQRRFAPVMVAEPSVPAAIAMMRGLRERLCAHHQVSIDDAALVAAVKLSDRYIQGRFLPDKAIDLIDEACAELKMQKDSAPQPLRALASRIADARMQKEALLMEGAEKNAEKLRALEAELAELCEQEVALKAQLASEQKVFDEISRIHAQIDALQTEAKQAIAQGNFQRASELEYGQIPALRTELDAANERWQAAAQNGTLLKSTVDAEAIALVLERATGIKAGALLASEREQLEHMSERLNERVIAQSEAVAAVVRAVKIAKAGLAEPNKPIGSFLFAGSTGVGKTELAKQLARELFGDERALIRFDMNEYAEEYRISQLLGSARGYVGSEQGGDLTEAVRNRPYCVLLFDEIEKAHPSIFNVFLNMLDEGALRDNAGNLVSFKNAVIIFTSNAGVQEVARAAEQGGDTRAALIAALGRYFKPEFLNRLSEIVAFSGLDETAAEQIAALQVQKLCARLAEQGLALEVAPAAVSYLAREGFSAEFGARQISRAIALWLQAPLSEAIIAGDFNHRAKVSAGADGLEFCYE